MDLRNQHDDPMEQDTVERVVWRPALLSAILLVVLGGICVAFWITEDGPRAPVPVLKESPVPAFTLTDQRGEIFESSTLSGKVWVANFIFTSCAAACPAMTRQMGVLQNRLQAAPALAKRVQLVSFSVDPKRDQPAKLEQFAKGYGADERIWHLVTGKEGEVAELSQKGFMLPAAEGQESRIPTHSDRFTLVDAAGRIRAYYQPSEQPEDIDRLVEDIRSLLSEDPQP